MQANMLNEQPEMGAAAPAQSACPPAIGPPASGPSSRALEFMDQLNDQESPVRKQLCIAVHRINMAMITENQRLLTQVWLPGFTSDGVLALTCDCAPYAIGGDSDLCSLFRCVSCRYTFRPTSAHKQGSIGRVFVTHQPEVCSNLGEAPTHIFHRAREAKECSMRSMCTMPLWVPDITKNAPMAVIEILQPESQPDFEYLYELTTQALKSVTETLITIHAPTATVNQSHGSRGAASSAPDEQKTAKRGQGLQSVGEGTSWEGSLASPEIQEPARSTGESPPHDAAAISACVPAGQDAIASRPLEFRSLPIPLSGNSSATPTSVQTPDTQITTGATADPISEELAAALRRSPSPPARATAASMSAPVALSGLPQLPTVDPTTSAATLQVPSNNPQSPPQQQQQLPPTLTQTSVQHAHALQAAAQKRVLEFVQAQAQACANDAAVGMDRLSLRTPTSGEIFIDGHLAPPALPGTLRHPAHSQLSNSGEVGSGDMPLVLCNTDSRANVSSGQLDAPVSHGMNGSVDALRGIKSEVNRGAQKVASAAGRLGGEVSMHDIDTDPFADGWELGESPQALSLPADSLNRARSVSASAVQRGLSSMMQMPNSMHRSRLQPLTSAPASQQARHLDPSPQSRRLRHVMEEGGHTSTEREGRGVARDSATASALLTALHNESHNYVVQKLFSKADLDSDRHNDSVHARKKRISPGPGRRSSGGLPDMPGPSTALPFLPDLSDEPSHPRSADATLGMRTGAAMTSPSAAGTGAVATAADRGGSLLSPQYDAQLRQFVHPGAVGGRETFVRVTQGTGPAHVQDTGIQRTFSSPLRAGGVASHSNRGTFWKVPAQAGQHGGAGEEGGVGASASAGYQGASSNLTGAHVMYQNYANDVKALRSKVNRIDGGIGRKVTLDVLKRQFGKGLKEAADNLGMCPTTLKRACRRLGVKRWPRTAEAANQALIDAEAAQRESSAVGHSDDNRDAAS